MKSLVTFVAVITATACCVYGVWGLTVTVDGFEDRGFGNPPPAYQQGDTVTFLATEWFANASCRTPAEPSTVDASSYEWRPSSSRNVELVAPGVFLMREVGLHQIRVSTSHADDILNFRIVPRIASLRLTPDSVTVSVGDTVRFLVEALDSTGAVITDVSRATGLVRLFGDPLDATNPIAANQADNDGVRFFWLAYRPGVMELEASVAVLGAHNLLAPGQIEVR